jgi:hypothetical protein
MPPAMASGHHVPSKRQSRSQGCQLSLRGVKIIRYIIIINMLRNFFFQALSSPIKANQG